MYMRSSSRYIFISGTIGAAESSDMDKTNGSDHGAATAPTDISLSCKSTVTDSLSSLSFSLSERERGIQFFF